VKLIAMLQASRYGEFEKRISTHTLANDPPAALTSMRRRTCVVCGAAVLTRPDGTQYGSATERTCDEVRRAQR
jgi:hypothetical protein